MLASALFAIYAVAFAWRALGGGLLANDDHPGQLYRVAHVLELGPWPWRLDPGWWAGYAELQYYPPGFAYAGALLSALSLGSLDVDRAYGVMLWVTFLAPGAATYALLTRVLGSRWLALPGAVIALTLSAGSRSGVEEGMRWGLVAARLGWALLPLLALDLSRWTERRAPPVRSAAILAGLILVHPAHAPAGIVLIALAAWHGPGARRARLARAVLLVAGGLGLAAFWLLPLVVHLEMALPLAWGAASLPALAAQVASRPLLQALVLASALAIALVRGAGPRDRWLALFAPAMALVIALDALLAQPLGIMWLPADRLMDSFLLAAIVGASIALRAACRRWVRSPDWLPAAAVVAVAFLLAQPRLPEPTLTTWPRSDPLAWPTSASIVTGTRLDDLWAALRRAPPGRVLFVRSGVPLDFREDWRRPHSHITSLAPLRAGRAIVNGTFTHPSPIAGLVYTGSAENRPIALLVEERDGRTLFGRPLADLTAAELDGFVRRLGISAVVAIDEDEGRLPFLTDNPAFRRPARIGPFLLFAAREPARVPERAALQRWTVPVTEEVGEWVSTGFAYSPLWRATAAGEPLRVRRDELGLALVQRPSRVPSVIALEHAPGAVEWIGLALTVVSALALSAWAGALRAARVRGGALPHTSGS